jgi:hypothetical protein
MRLVFDVHNHSAQGALFRSMYHPRPKARIDFLSDGGRDSAPKYWQLTDQLHRFNAHRYHLPHESHDVFFIISTVRVTRNAATFIGADLILVDNPIQRRPITKLVVEAFLGDTRESQ